MTTPTPTWYDVLGVRHDASTAEIKAAWRSATDKFEPGSGAGQFRMFNDAADVLLDPARRAEYDRSLERSHEGTTGGVAPEASPVVLGKGGSATTGTATRTDVERPAAPAHDERDTAVVAATEPAPRRGASRGLLLTAAVLVLLAVLAVAATAVYYVKEVRPQAAVADARSAAPAAAERAAKAMLSYDYRQLPADRNRAAGFLTAKYKREYLRTFTLLEKNKDGTPGLAVQSKSVVTATVLGSGVVDVDDSGDRARVLVFVNQISKKAEGDPQVFQNRVAMTMTKSGNRWLVEDLKSY